MTTVIQRAGTIWREFAARFVARRETGPIDSVAALHAFAASRSAFVAQKKLYGYLKTRMGTRYVSMFEDDAMIRSIDVAKMHVFAACLADLTIFCVARATAGAELDTDARIEAARACFRSGVEENAALAPEGAADDWLAEFDARLADVHWENAAASGEVFEQSPKALVRWAPIAPELKKYDAQIVRNSVRFAWNEVRMDFKARLDAAAIQAQLSGG